VSYPSAAFLIPARLRIRYSVIGPGTKPGKQDKMMKVKRRTTAADTLRYGKGIIMPVKSISYHVHAQILR
jgi:hypothetical protein